MNHLTTHFNNTMETKKYWQAKDKGGTVNLFIDKPRLCGKHYHRENMGNGFIECAVFPIPLKPLQIAEITVNEDGTWSYEIERQEGWYWARAKATNAVYPLQYKCGIWYRGIGNRIDAEPFTISQTRIPDECII